MKKAYWILWIVVLGTSFIACDKVNNPYETSATVGTDTTSEEVKRKVIIEDYTGHTCGNCPGAALTAGSLYDLYPGQVIVMAIHAGFFAEPYGGGAKYTTDFRTTAGDTYNTDFSVSGNPIGMVSRTEVDGQRVISPSAWGTAIASLVESTPDFDIRLKSDYNSSNRTVTIDIETEVVNEVIGNYNMVVSMVEDSIVDWQKNYSGTGDPAFPSPDAEFYVHNHVLRDVVNSSYGESVIVGSGKEGEVLTKSYTYTLHSDWKHNHCHIVGYIINMETKEIVQAEEISVEG